MPTRKGLVAFSQHPKLKNPVLIAAWPGMGEVAYKAVSFLIEKLKAKAFASVLPGNFFFPTGTLIEDGAVKEFLMPQSQFYYYQSEGPSPDIILFLSNAQPLPERAYEYAQVLLDSLKSYRIQRVYTFAAMPMATEHSDEPGVWVAVTERHLLKEMEGWGVRSMASGQITGLNGLMLSVVKEHGLEGMCFLAEIPLYAIQVENPRASLAALKTLSHLLKLDIDFGDLYHQAQYVEAQIEKLLDYLKQPPHPAEPIAEEDIQNIKQSLGSLTELPPSAKERVEELFREAKRDTSRAKELKEELDKWNVYKEYEDRFLDLFRAPHKDN